MKCNQDIASGPALEKTTERRATRAGKVLNERNENAFSERLNGGKRMTVIRGPGSIEVREDFPLQRRRNTD